jgi:Bacterial PH domain
VPGGDDHRRARWRPESSRIVKLPPPGPELTLRPHTTYAFVLELLVALLGLFTFLDVRGADWTIALVGLAVALVFGIGAPLAYRRSTHAGPDGVRIQGALSSRTLEWNQIDGFELLAHRPGRADRIGARTTDGELVPLIHQDAKALSMKAESARAFYTGLIDRLDTVRRTAGR